MKKKRDLTALALLGVSAGLIVGGCQQNSKNSMGKQGGNSPGSNGNATAEKMSSDMKTFYASLSPDAKKKFDQLDAQHKMMAVEMADQKCNGQNKCGGMGGCATNDHACAGQNSCKGQGGAPVKESNKAVEVQYKNQMNGGNGNGNRMNGNNK